MEKLKPCPFCGNRKPIMSWDIEGEPNGIYCNYCKAMVKFPITAASEKETYGETLDKWAEKWNDRGNYFS